MRKFKIELKQGILRPSDKIRYVNADRWRIEYTGTPCQRDYFDISFEDHYRTVASFQSDAILCITDITDEESEPAEQESQGRGL